MSVALLQPWALVALVAGLVPLLLHLTRSTEATPTPFAALRWLDARVRPKRRVRLHEMLLLVLRLLLVAGVALLLARPVWTGAPFAPAHWVGVADGVDVAAARALVDDAGADWHRLAPGFPSLADAYPPADAPIASLLRELDARLPARTRVTVVVPEALGGHDAERVRLARAIDWRVLPGRTPDPPAAAPGAPVLLALRGGAEAESARRVLRAIVAAWNQRDPGRYTLDPAPVSATLPPAGAWLAWLDAPPTAELTEWIEAGGTALIDARTATDAPASGHDARGEPIAYEVRVGRGRRVELAAGFAPASLPAMLDADFPARLHALFAPAPPPPARAQAASIAPVQALQAPAPLPEPLDLPLACALALVFALERLLASGRRAEAAA